MKITQLLLFTFLLIQSSFVSAQPEIDVAKRLQERFPHLKVVNEIVQSPIPGLLEVRFNESEIVYVDASANYLLAGNLVETATKTNLTEKRIAKLTELKFSALPLADAIKVVRGKGERQVAVFVDPNCGFCKEFEKTLGMAENVTIHYFLYPVLGSDSKSKSVSIRCAADQSKAWFDWMLKGLPPSPKQCRDDAIERNVGLGAKHRISGTPTLIFPSNVRTVGAIDRGALENHLNGK